MMEAEATLLRSTDGKQRRCKRRPQQSKNLKATLKAEAGLSLPSGWKSTWRRGISQGWGGLTAVRRHTLRHRAESGAEGAQRLRESLQSRSGLGIALRRPQNASPPGVESGGCHRFTRTQETFLREPGTISSTPANTSVQLSHAAFKLKWPREAQTASPCLQVSSPVASPKNFS